MIVRAEQKHLNMLVEMGMDFMEYYPFNLGDDEDALRIALSTLIDHAQVFVKVNDHGEPIAAVAGQVAPCLYNPTLTVMYELFLWVVPEERNMGIATELVAVIEETAEFLGCDIVSMCSTTLTQDFSNFLVEIDYQPTEMALMKRIN